MKARQAMMGTIHQSAALHRLAKAIAAAASEEPGGTVEFRNPSAAIYSASADVADEPGSFATQSAWSPPDWHPLVNGLPVLAEVRLR